MRPEETRLFGTVQQPKCSPRLAGRMRGRDAFESVITASTQRKKNMGL